MLKRTDSTSPTNQLATKLYIVHGGGRLLLSGGGVDSINVSLWACFCWCLCFCKKEKRGWSGQCPILSAPVASDSTRHDRTQRTLEPTPPPRTTNLLQNNNTVLCYLLFPTMGSIQSHPDHKEEVISTSNIKNMSVLRSLLHTWVFFCHLSHHITCGIVILLFLYHLLHHSFQAKRHSPSLLYCNF